MNTADSTLASIRLLIEPVLSDAGYELYDLRIVSQGGKATLRISIDSPEGIGLEDCERASRKVSLLLDVEDPLKFAYSLEVSSPGIFRELRDDKDFERFAGERVKVILQQEAGGGCHFGALTQWGADSISIQESTGRQDLERALIKRIELAPIL